MKRLNRAYWDGKNAFIQCKVGVNPYSFIFTDVHRFHTYTQRHQESFYVFAAQMRRNVCVLSFFVEMHRDSQTTKAKPFVEPLSRYQPYSRKHTQLN